MTHKLQGYEQARPLDVAEQWKMARQNSSYPVFPGFSCQFLKEDDAHEKEKGRREGEPPSEQLEQPTLFWIAT